MTTKEKYYHNETIRLRHKINIAEANESLWLHENMKLEEEITTLKKELHEVTEKYNTLLSTSVLSDDEVKRLLKGNDAIKGLMALKNILLK